MQKFGNMLSYENQGVPFLHLSSFEKQAWLNHAFATRLGGVSTGVYAAMNLGFGRGDSEKAVLENYRRFCSAAGFSIENLVATAQTHQTRILRVGASERGAGILRPKPWHDIDGLVTNEAEVSLCVYGADCVPLLFADPVQRAIGVAHAGWRGTAAGIAAVTVSAMEREFGTRANDLLVGIGPSIGPCCFEVDEPVVQAFLRVSVLADAHCITEQGNGKWKIDLWEANAQILRCAGVRQIEKGMLCTRCHPDLLWSHRATGGKRGGMCGILSIRG
ncbi:MULTISPECIES: peptidoglycan editing factor PgeF [Caproicibacterium]|uniref:Purine nucleoside phosphorylase n=1 Tax=Caproicibacterium argilliputei TaxID=3030016 RepID=A0AA97D5Q4_9FIRM|nr:peptidoglycan editing factor PgeF [Caproicibacterium argilliputei]WOC31070.1 peptidoglycan editing factor PgeF [Caproicibacterium argilliputei]